MDAMDSNIKLRPFCDLDIALFASCLRADPDNKASCEALLSAGYIFDDINRLYCYRFYEKSKQEIEQQI